MRALVVLNPGSGSLAKLGIDRGRERVQSGGNIDRALFAECWPRKTRIEADAIWKRAATDAKFKSWSRPTNF
jgi:hypothetical protein